jgi:hypothetical protein
MRLTIPQMKRLRDYRDRPHLGSSGVISRLAAKGLLESDGSDGRYRITDAGRAVLDGQSPEINKALKILLSN